MQTSLKVEGYLKTIADKTESRPSFNIIISDNTSSIRTTFSPPLIFPQDCHYEMAVCSLETYYSFPNIDDSNNTLKVSLNKGVKWNVIKIPTGCYEINAINIEIRRQVVKAGGKKDDVLISPNLNTLQCILVLKNDNIVIDFNVDDSLRSVLGFSARKCTGPGRFESENVVNIMNVNSIMVHCDIIGGSRLNGEERPIIYIFFHNVGPGEKIVTRPKNLIYLPITLGVISRMTCWLTDQDNKPLNLRGEELTITFHIKSCRLKKMLYKPVKVNVPERIHEKLKLAISHENKKNISVKVKLDDGDEGDRKHTLLLTRGQIDKLERARLIGKKHATVRLSSKQVQAILKHEGGFLGTSGSGPSYITRRTSYWIGVWRRRKSCKR